MKWDMNNVHSLVVTPIPLASPKTCNTCGFSHLATTPNAVIDNWGHLHFNCPCGSSLILMRWKPLCLHPELRDTPDGVICLDCFKPFPGEG